MKLPKSKALAQISRGSLHLLTSVVRRPTGNISPGTAVFIGERKTDTVKLSRIHYSAKTCDEEVAESTDAFFPIGESDGVTWINVSGVHDTDLINDIGEAMGLHPLVLGDIANTRQRPKFDDYESHIYVVLRMLRYDSSEQRIINEQISVILGPNYVLTFQEWEGDVFDSLRQRIRDGKGRVRTQGADYLFYALLDAVVDGYFAVIEGIGEYVESVENVVMSNPQPGTLADIHDLRTQTAFLRKSVWPLREALSALDRTESGLIKKGTKTFLRDVYDHSVQLIDTIEAFRDVASSLFETHLSMVGNQQNETMKVLTIIATIFIPITFIAGIYGMNFEKMPELSQPWGYPAVWGVMIGVTLIMLLYFKKKNWL